MAPRGLFVTATDTGAGKTYVAAVITRCLVQSGVRTGVYKPVASGCVHENGTLQSGDAVRLWESAGCPGRLEDVCPQRFAAALAPHLAARREGRDVDVPLLRTGLDRWTAHYGTVVVEGAGGLLSPLADDVLVADLAHDFGFPLVVVTANRLGAINHTLLTIAAARHYRGGIPLAGVILNHPDTDPGDPSRDSNGAEIERLSGVPVLATVPHGGQTFDRSVDWWGLAAGGAGATEPSGRSGPGVQ